jgi:hypothetical protein
MRPTQIVSLAALLAVPALAAAQDTPWRQHDLSRPRPPVVSSAAEPGAPPSDAVVLFDGTSLAAWRGNKGAEAARWVVRDGYMEAAPGTGAIQTAAPLGDMQLHVEWAAPTPVKGRGQGRGNSGVIIMGLYEVQILDSYENTTYADGQAAAVYGQYPPLVNASRPPGAWQSYDIVFRGPRWNAAGALTRRARLTVFHNGVLVQDNVQLWGGTAWLRHARYAPHPDKLPLVLQDHSNPVRFRNIWMRALPDEPATPPRAGIASDLRRVPPAQLRAYAGTYRTADGESCRVIFVNGRLGLSIFDRPDTMPLVTAANGEFTFQETAGRVRFTPASGSSPIQLDVSVAEVERHFVRVP